MALLPAAICAAADSRPAPAPATIPATEPAPAKGLIVLPPEQEDLWKLTAARPHRLWEDIFFVLVRKTADLPAILPDQFEQLDRPSYKRLVNDPTRYVGMPVEAIRMKVKVVRVYKLLPGPGSEMPFSKQWPSDRPLWRLDCLNAEAARPADQPLMIFSAADPTGLLPKSPKEPEGPLVAEYKGKPPSYPNLPALEVAAVFYKTHITQDDAGNPRDYPVLLTWQARGEKTEEPASAKYLFPLILIAMLTLGIVVLLFIKRRMKKPAPGSLLRERLSRPPIAGQQQEGADTEVDPELKAAVEEYEKEKGHAHDKDDPG